MAAIELSFDLINSNIYEFMIILSKIYTKECFLYKTLNNILRSDNLIQINNLFPYYICF